MGGKASASLRFSLVAVALAFAALTISLTNLYLTAQKTATAISTTTSTAIATTTPTIHRSIESVKGGWANPWPGPRLLPEDEMGDYPWLLRCGQLPDLKDESEEWMWLGMLTKLADTLDGPDVPYWSTLVKAHGAGADGYYWAWIEGDKVKELNRDVIATIVGEINRVAREEVGFTREVPVKFAEATGLGGYDRPIVQVEPVIEIIEKSKLALIFRPALVNYGEEPVVIRHGCRLFDVRVYRDGVIVYDSTTEVRLCVLVTSTIKPGEAYSGTPVVKLRGWLNGPGRYRILAWADFAPVEPLKDRAEPGYVGLRVERWIEISD